MKYLIVYCLIVCGMGSTLVFYLLSWPVFIGAVIGVIAGLLAGALLAGLCNAASAGDAHIDALEQAYQDRINKLVEEILNDAEER